MVERPDYFRSTAVSRDAARVSCSSFMPDTDINPAILPQMLCKSVASKKLPPDRRFASASSKRDSSRIQFARKNRVLSKKKPATAGCSSHSSWD